MAWMKCMTSGTMYAGVARLTLPHYAQFKACDSDFNFQLREPLIVYGLSKQHYLQNIMMTGFLQCCLLMTYDYKNIAEDLVIFFNGGSLKTLDK